MSAKPTNHRPPANSKIAALRREQIVEAAVHIIISHGLHNLSLSKIEAHTKMKRGQLTYYFPTKEDILLAVFDRLLMMLFKQIHGDIDIEQKHGLPPLWQMVMQALNAVMRREPISWDFHALQYTFLAQMAHRDDFRAKLANMFSEMRLGMSAHYLVTATPSAVVVKNVSPKTITSFFQAIMHGLTMQLAVDPDAFDRQEMLTLCITLLAPLFTTAEPHNEPPKPSRKKPGGEKRP